MLDQAREMGINLNNNRNLQMTGGGKLTSNRMYWIMVIGNRNKLFLTLRNSRTPN